MSAGLKFMLYMKTKLAISKVKDALKSKGYVFFDKGDYNLNIIGVRTSNKIANNFDDYIFCIYKVKSIWYFKEWSITTDAGTYWLKNPSVLSGTALLVPNQYRGIYKLDKHRGGYTALCQRNGQVDVYRDNDKNVILDYEPDTIESGYFGINIHRSNPKKESTKVNKWSAGCQVFQSPLGFDTFIDLCIKSSEIFGNSFTYTLLTENDFNN